MSGLAKSPIYAILVQRPDAPLEEFPVDKNSVSVGRVKTNDIVIIGDSAISREHCRFDLDRGIDLMTVRDLGSSNGTFMNGEPVGALPITVRSGDKVQVGATILSIMVDRTPVLEVTQVVKEKQRFGVPLPYVVGEERRWMLNGDICTCGRCGESFRVSMVDPGDKIGCARCRAIWIAVY